MKFIWSDKYTVNIKEIDEQHQHYFDITNEIYALLDKKDVNYDTLMAVISELGNYAFYHLSTEEKYFAEFNYKDAESHIKAHNSFRQKVESYLVEARNSSVKINELTENVTDFAVNWLADHILVMDKKYTDYFNSHGLR